MENLINFLSSSLKIYLTKYGYCWIDEDSWIKAIRIITGLPMDGTTPGESYIYDIAANELGKEIYNRTRMKELKIVSTCERIDTYIWDEKNEMYYNKETDKYLSPLPLYKD